MTTPDDLSILKEKSFSGAVKNFEELLSDTRRAFLIGAGCSRCAGLPSMDELTEFAINSTELKGTNKQILCSIKQHFNGASSSHIEDYLSELGGLACDR